MQIGMIGLDTSHCEIFTKLLNDKSNPFHITGANVVKAIPFYSPELSISADRVGHFTTLLRDSYGVEMVEELSEFCSGLDGILITAVDGSTHLDWLKKIAPFGLPIFIDKPIALSSKDVKEIREIAELHQIQVMSSSSLRYADGLIKAMNSMMDSSIQSVYIYGPLPMQEGFPGYFWYGIHMLEMAFAIMGICVQAVEVERFEHYELCRLTYDQGRSAIIRGDYNMHGRFGFVAHTPSNSLSAELWKDEKPYYASLLERIISYFQTGIPPVSLQETQKLIDVIEEINRKREYCHDSAN